jgi:hypothetical protein
MRARLAAAELRGRMRDGALSGELLMIDCQSLH